MTPDTHALLRQDSLTARAEQVKAATAALWQYDKGVRWPWEAFHRIAGPSQPGHIDLVAADSGSGKTTWVASLILGWLLAGVTVVVGGYELGSETLRRYLAAMVCGVDPGKFLGGELFEQYDDASRVGDPTVTVQVERMKPWFELVKAVDFQLKQMHDHEGPWEQLFVMDDDYCSRNAVLKLGDTAKAWGGPVVCVVDHIDHLEPSANEFRASKEANMAVQEHAKKFGTRWVITSQLNRSGNTGGDTLWKHRPLFEHFIKNGGFKKELAVRTWGLYRPLKLGLTTDEIKAYREGRTELSTILQPNAVALNVIKHRPVGSRTGQRVLLGWQDGRVIDAPDELKRAVEAQQHGIATAFRG